RRLRRREIQQHEVLRTLYELERTLRRTAAVRLCGALDKPQGGMRAAVRRRFRGRKRARRGGSRHRRANAEWIAALFRSVADGCARADVLDDDAAQGESENALVVIVGIRAPARRLLLDRRSRSGAEHPVEPGFQPIL